ncbi:MAG TPA: Hsp20/alpha crystallin family protein [Modestobacter sp.]|jgi:HSP20 family protein|nr:Hsp20/alpha crystallin family protein [Modestobacter sp.]
MSLPVQPPRATARWDPFRELDQLYERMNRLWEANAPDQAKAWVPLGDVEETDDAYEIDVELPGVDQDDVVIEVNGREVTVAGEIKEKERTGIMRRRTRRVGEFQYSVTLPGDIDPENVTAQLDGGVLTVTVPKSQRAKPRRVPIGTT